MKQKTLNLHSENKSLQTIDTRNMTNIFNSKTLLLSLSCSSIAVLGQIGEERLILQRKKISNIQRVEKKKTSIPILKNYPPEEKNAEKIDYTITNIPLVSDFKTSHIEGKDMSIQLVPEKYNNYARIGAGNYGKILADASFNASLSDTFELITNAHFNHTEGLTKDYDWNSQSRNMQINAGVNGYFEKGKLNALIGADDKRFNYYGIYAMAPQNTPTNLAQKATTATFSAHYDHYSNHILNDIRLKVARLEDGLSASETHIIGNVNLSKHAIPLNWKDISLNIDAGIGTELVTNSFEILKNTQNKYFVASATPKLTFFKENSKVVLGSNFSSLNAQTIIDGKNEHHHKTLWFPQAEINIGASPEINFFFGVKGGIQQNTYGKMLGQTPFLLSNQQTRPTQEKYNLYFGISGDIQQKFTYSTSFGIAKIQDILHFAANPLFNTDIATQRKGYDYANTFSALYADGNINQFSLALDYIPLQNLALKGEFQYMDYKLNDGSKILNRPNFIASFGANYTALEKKLILGAKGFVVGNRNTNQFAFSENAGQYVSTETITQLPAYFDLNLSAEYQFHKNFSAFIMGDNLLNNKYQTMVGYKVLGAQILGGIKVKF